MGKNMIQLNEAQLKSLISEAVKNAMYDFASDKPQYDINSDEWNRNYDQMERDYGHIEAEKQVTDKTSFWGERKG